MVTWFLNLPIEQRGWVLLGAGLVLLGVAVAVFTWAENRFQRRQDRANVPAETVVMPRVDTAALRRHLVRYGDDTEGGGSR